MPQRNKFYKMAGSQMTFRLVDEIEEDIYNVWAGNRPLKEDVVVDNEGKIHTKDETKFLKKEEFSKLFPHYNRTSHIRRNIMVDGIQYTFDFPFGANNSLNKAISIIKVIGLNPLNYDFVLKKNGQGLTTRYEIITEGVTNQEIQSLQPHNPVTQPIQQHPSVQQSRPFSPFSLPIDYQSINLNRDEIALLDYISIQNESYSEQRFIELWAFNIVKAGEGKTGFNADRTRRIYNEKYKKQ